jgi:hypothetical protein
LQDAAMGMYSFNYQGGMISIERVLMSKKIMDELPGCEDGEKAYQQQN